MTPDPPPFKSPETLCGWSSGVAKPHLTTARNQHDQELEKAITQAAAGAASQVIPFSFDPEKDKAGTVKAAAKRIVKTMGVPVHVGYNATFPNTILLSRGVLSNRGRRSK